jgi:hypothetical protein
MSMATHMVELVVEDELIMASRPSFRMSGGKLVLRKPLSSRDSTTTVFSRFTGCKKSPSFHFSRHYNVVTMSRFMDILGRPAYAGTISGELTFTHLLVDANGRITWPGSSTVAWRAAWALPFV